MLGGRCSLPANKSCQYSYNYEWECCSTLYLYLAGDVSASFMDSTLQKQMNTLYMKNEHHTMHEGKITSEDSKVLGVPANNGSEVNIRKTGVKTHLAICSGMKNGGRRDGPLNFIIIREGFSILLMCL
jgi:hypothetical protein